jgi:hypothetical protein
MSQVHETLSDPSAATPSTTAVATAEALSGLGRMYNRPPKGVEPPPETAALGAVVGDGVRVHSSVSPGLVAEQVRLHGLSTPRVWKAGLHSKGGARQQQDGISKCLQGGRAHPLAARTVSTIS